MCSGFPLMSGIPRVMTPQPSSLGCWCSIRVVWCEYWLGIISGCRNVIVISFASNMHPNDHRCIQNLWRMHPKWKCSWSHFRSLKQFLDHYMFLSTFYYSIGGTKEWPRIIGVGMYSGFPLMLGSPPPRVRKPQPNFISCTSIGYYAILLRNFGFSPKN